MAAEVLSYGALPMVAKPVSGSHSAESSSQRAHRVQKDASRAQRRRDEKRPTATEPTPSRAVGGAPDKADPATRATGTRDGGFVFRYRAKEEQDADAKAVYEEMVAHLKASGQEERAMKLPLWNAPAPLHPEREKRCLELFGAVPSLPRASVASVAFVKRQQPLEELKNFKRRRRHRVSKP